MEINFLSVDRDSDNNDIVIRNDGAIVARMEHNKGYNDETEETLMEAAKLFAASGDLLTQLKNVVECLGPDWHDEKDVQSCIRLIQSIDQDWKP